MSEANKQFHMAIAEAGKNPYLTAFYERLLDQGRRMLHLHFQYIERTHDGYLLTDEHVEMLDAIRARDIARADTLAAAHTRQYRDNFLNFMRENYAASMPLGTPNAGLTPRRPGVASAPNPPEGCADDVQSFGYR